MYEKSCASSNHIKSWKDIDFGTAEYEVKKLQMRIAKAVKENRVGKIKSLQWTLTHSFYAKAIAVKRVTENKGKRTPGVDGVCWISNEDKFNAIFTLQRRGYQPQPLRRIYIPKKNGKKRPLSIPTMKDRAMQTLHKMALEPVTETLASWLHKITLFTEVYIHHWFQLFWKFWFIGFQSFHQYACPNRQVAFFVYNILQVRNIIMNITAL